MAKGHKMPAAHGNEVNVTPLIDVIMCLIIFFMLVTKIGVSTGAKPMMLPESYLGKKIDNMGTAITLNLIPIGDLKEIEADRAEPTGVQVTALVDGFDRELPLQTGAGVSMTRPLRETLVAMKKHYGDELQVIIRADAKLTYQMIEPVLVECAKAGASNVNFNTKKGNRPTD
jgi:biopolymer transport protein ExbD